MGVEMLKEAPVGDSSVILVWDSTSEEGLKRISEYWLPRMTQECALPIVLVANKSIRSNEPSNPHHETLLELMKDFPAIDTIIETCAWPPKAAFNISEAFYYARKAVIFPVAPLISGGPGFDISTRVKEGPLRRCFALLDEDGDGLINDAELAKMQKSVFQGADVSPARIAELRTTVFEQGGREALSEDGTALTLKGFHSLCQLFMDRSCVENVWAMLRGFGYTNELTLQVSSWATGIPKGSEISSQAISFLAGAFNRHDAEHHGHLARSHFSRLVEPIMLEIAEHVRFAQDAKYFSEDFWFGPAKDAQVSLLSFVARWNWLAVAKPELTVFALACLGATAGSSPRGTSIGLMPADMLEIPSSRDQRMLFRVGLYTDDDEEDEELANKVIHNFVGRDAVPSLSQDVLVEAIPWMSASTEKFLSVRPNALFSDLFFMR